MSRPPSLLKLEQDAYYAVLRALAVNELDWTKEKLLTDLRNVLNITNDQHFKFLEEVMADKLVLRLQSTKNAAPASANVSPYEAPPLPRQQSSTPGGAAQRKPGRPPSANFKHQPSLISPVAKGASRPNEPALSGEKRGRGTKRDHDDIFEPKRSNPSTFRSFKSSIGGRGRGRGRRIVGITRDASAIMDLEVLKKFKILPFESKMLEERLASALPAELKEMQTALCLKEQSIQKHLDLLQQLEDDTLGTTNPLKYCQILIQELELTEERISSQLEALQSEDEL